MLYLAETGDGKQKFRNRLFVIWFNNYEKRHNYILKTAEGKMDGQDNFMALIASIDNPRLAQAIEEFEETVDILFGQQKRQNIGIWKRLKVFFCYLFKKMWELS